MTSGISNLDEFLAGLDLDIAAVDATILEETKAAADIVVDVVVPGTPVLTGLHRGSWTVGVGSDPGPSGNPLDPSGGETIARAKSAIETARAKQAIIIVNDGPAIEELDEGRSDKAPEGFTLRAVDAATRRT